MLRPLTLAAAIALLPLGLSAQTRAITITGQNGGTIEKQHDCSRGEGQAACSNQTQVTGANGKTYSKSRQRTAADGVSTTTITRTGPQGQTNTRSRQLVVTR